MTSSPLIAGRPGSAVVMSSASSEEAVDVSKAFKRLQNGSDIRGVAIAGMVRNIFLQGMRRGDGSEGREETTLHLRRYRGSRPE